MWAEVGLVRWACMRAEPCALPPPAAQCTFGPRLGDDEIRQLAEYVLAQANAGWPAPQ